MIGQVLEPRVFLCSVPVLHLGRNSDDGAGSHLNGSLAPFLIPAAPSNADEHLYLLVVNMPVIAAARLVGDVLQTRYTRRSVALRRAHHTTTDICQLHALLKNLCHVCPRQIQITGGIADGALGDAGNHIFSGTQLSDGQGQTYLLHPGFQGLQTSFGYLFVGHFVALDIPHVLGEAHKLRQTVLHGAAIVGH